MISPTTRFKEADLADNLKRITYVEDEPDIRTIAELALTRIGGFELQVCASGHEAVDQAPEFMPHLILLDVMMPGIDGLETLSRLRKQEATAKTPVIFMTAKAQRHETDEYRSLGAIGVIPKPFDPMELPTTIVAIWHAAAANDEGANAD